MRSVWLLIMSAIAAIAASLCCIGAITYVLFGVAIASLNALDIPNWVRIVFSIIAIASLLMAIYTKFNGKCQLKSNKNLVYIIVSFFVIFMLTFPEIAGYFYE